MPPRQALSSLSPAFSRRLAKTPLRRKTFQPLTSTISTPIRSFATQSDVYETPTNARPSLHARYIQAGGRELPSPAALSALLARIGLSTNPTLQDELLACLTHPSYNPIRPSDAGPSPENPLLPNNELLDILGNSLLGMFASEHLARKFPLLPTETLKLALTAYVGPTACESVARELGVGVTRGPLPGLIGVGQETRLSSGIAVRWERTDSLAPKVQVGERFKKYMPEPESSTEAQSRTKVTYEAAVASAVRAMVGLVYQEKGIHAARDFVTAHWLTRHLDLPSLFAFRSPMAVLDQVVRRHLAEAGVPATSSAGRIEKRILAETGIQSHRPLINIGLFLPSGLKLSEGFGSSYKMAEHRAANNALLSLFLVRGDQKLKIGTTSPSPSDLPSMAHTDFPIDLEGLVSTNRETYKGSGFGGLESVESSSRRTVRAGRARSAKYTVPV